MGVGKLAIGQKIKWNGEVYSFSGRATNKKWRLQSVQFQDIREEEEEVIITAIKNKEIFFLKWKCNETNE